MFLNFDVHNKIIQFVVCHYHWTKRIERNYDRYNESSCSVASFYQRISIVSIFFLRLEESRFTYSLTISANEITEILWCDKSSCIIVCDMYFDHLLHFSHERFIFSSKIIESSSNFERNKLFKLRTELLDQYYVNENEIMKTIWKKTLTKSFNESETSDISFRTIHFFNEVLNQEIEKVTIVFINESREDRVIDYLKQKVIKN